VLKVWNYSIISLLISLLQLFFEGVQAKVAQGVKESEVSYQMAFSKQELRKVIKEYPAREVKKGLESLYKKVEKHLSEEENLLQASLAFLYNPFTGLGCLGVVSILEPLVQFYLSFEQYECPLAAIKFCTHKFIVRGL
jgi:Exocyst complex component Sec3